MKSVPNAELLNGLEKFFQGSVDAVKDEISEKFLAARKPYEPSYEEATGYVDGVAACIALSPDAPFPLMGTPLGYIVALTILDAIKVIRAGSSLAANNSK